MVHGKRQGLCTRTYPDGRTEEEHYLNGMRIDLKKAADRDLDNSPAFDLIQDRYPWFLFAMEAFGFDKTYVRNYLDTTETLLASYAFEPEEFNDYYGQVLDSISETPV